MPQPTQYIKHDDALHQRLTTLRKNIHQHPELAYQEYRTAALVEEQLKALGLEVHTQWAETGIVAILRGTQGDGRHIALRADLDALPLSEENTFEHASVHANTMHACGHDGHTTMLLGAADYLSQHADFAGCIYFIFQPAEEGYGGAKKMIDEGLFETFPIEEVYGMHNWPAAEPGTFSIHENAVMASTDTFDITVQGLGGHGGIPHNSKDPIVISSQLISSIQSIVSRNIPATKSGVISVTKIHAGTAYNIIPDTVALAGTIRSFEPAQRKYIQQRLHTLCKGIASAFDIHIDITFTQGYPATINHPEQARYCYQAASHLVDKKDIYWNPEPSMGAEDFAYMLEIKPGAYIWIGNGGGSGSCELHNPLYDFNDDIIPLGANYWIELAYQRCATPTD